MLHKCILSQMHCRTCYQFLFSFPKRFVIRMFLFAILVQERLTKQIAIAVAKAINPTGVGVIIEAA